MMAITEQELRDDLAEILRRVAGESIEITNDGVVVAELRPPSQRSELDRLRALGQVRAATTPPTAVRDIDPVVSDVTTHEMIDDLRGPRL